MSLPAIYNFPDTYGNDGIQPFKITLKYSSGAFVDLVGASVLMQLRNGLNIVIWEFSTAMDGDNQLLTLANGVIQFPKINSWSIPPSCYVYDLQVTDSTGFVRTYIKGTWKLLPDVTKPV